MHTIVVQLQQLFCAVTSSKLSSDAVLFAGYIRTDQQTVAVTFPIIKINDGEPRNFSQYGQDTFILNAEQRFVEFGFAAWDIDTDGFLKDLNSALAYIGDTIGGIFIAAGNLPVGAGTIGASKLSEMLMDKIIGLDGNDLLFTYDDSAAFGLEGFGERNESKTLTPNFRGPAAVADCNYSLTIQIDSPKGAEVQPNYDFGDLFRVVGRKAVADGYVGGFPTCNFLTRPDSSVWMPTVVFTADQATWRDVPLFQLHSIDLADFGGRMRATQDYALPDFQGGFPNFESATYEQVVCGTILLSYDVAEFHDLDVAGDLGGVPSQDIGRRFLEATSYAIKRGYVGGFPNFYQAPHDGSMKNGHILIKPRMARVVQYPLYLPPR